MEQMREIEKERLGAMHVGADFAEAREKFTHDDHLIKVRHPQPSRDDPDQKYRERCKPRPPAAPCRVAAGVSPVFPKLENHDPRQQERVNDRAFDQHSERQ